MGATPWMTTQDLVSAVQRKIAMPIYQSTFSTADIQNFLNEEMMISQVPQVLLLHEEYYVHSLIIPVLTNVSAYSIPERAIGMRLRDIKYVDQQGNFFDMTQIPPEDKAFFQRAVADSDTISKFYIQGNDVVLTPSVISSPTGQLAMYYYIRPNQLVDNSRAAIIADFTKTLTISNNSNIQAGLSNIVVNGITFSPVSSYTGGVNTFVIGVDAPTTAANFVAVFNAGGYLPSSITASNVEGIITLTSLGPIMTWNINNTGCYTYTNTLNMNFTSTVPANIVPGGLIDFLQTAAGHIIYDYDITPVSISTSSMVFNDTDVPLNLVVGDYICQQYECIIPYLPSDLHNGLADRACTRILAAQGDLQGLQASQAKIQEIDQQTMRVLADRAEGTPLKINGRGSILRYTSMGNRRRL
jgi:hypothetical protein